MHDESLERTTSGKGDVSERTWQFISQLQAGTLYDQKVPLLSQVLDKFEKSYMHGSNVFIVDVKNTNDLRILDPLL